MPVPTDWARQVPRALVIFFVAMLVLAAAANMLGVDRALLVLVDRSATRVQVASETVSSAAADMRRAVDTLHDSMQVVRGAVQVLGLTVQQQAQVINDLERRLVEVEAVHRTVVVDVASKDRVDG